MVTERAAAIRRLKVRNTELRYRVVLAVVDAVIILPHGTVMRYLSQLRGGAIKGDGQHAEPLAP